MRRFFRRSITLQVMVPTILLLLLAGLLAVQRDKPRARLPVTIDNTFFRLQIRAYGSMAGGRLDIPAYLASDEVRLVRRSNPDFRFSFFSDTQRYGTSGSRLTQLLRDRAAIKPGSMATRCEIFSAFEPVGRVGGNYTMFNACGDPLYYMEFRNVHRPVAFPPVRRGQPLRTRLAAMLTSNLAAIGLALFLVGVIGALGLRTMRRIARAAAEFDIDRGHDVIPLDDLAIEVRPLVRIINTLAGRLRDSYQRQQLFLAAAAHELRTPLAVLRVRAETLAPSPERDAVMGDMRNLSHIANQLLDLTAISRREDRHDFLLASTIEDAILDMRGEAPACPIALRMPPEGDWPERDWPERDWPERDWPERDWIVRGGNAQLFSVAILNLLRNAASVSPAGVPVVVTIGEDGIVTIEDAGPGVDPCIRDKLFEPFVKYPAGRDGSGLGLAIVREIIAFHGGGIVHFTPTGGGAGFRMDLHAESCGR